MGPVLTGDPVGEWYSLPNHPSAIHSYTRLLIETNPTWGKRRIGGVGFATSATITRQSTIQQVLHDSRNRQMSDEEVTKKEMRSLNREANENFAGFTLSLQEFSEAAQLKILEQIPDFRKLAKNAIKTIDKAFETTMRSNDENEKALAEGYKQWRDALDAMLADPDLSIGDKLLISAEFEKIMQKQAAKDTEGKQFKGNMFVKVAGATVLGVALVVVAIRGGKLTPGG
jgi:hypothetical protein